MFMHQADFSSFVYYLFEVRRVCRRMRDSAHPLNSGEMKEDVQRDPVVLCPTYPPPDFYLEGGVITYKQGLKVI